MTKALDHQGGNMKVEDIGKYCNSCHPSVLFLFCQIFIWSVVLVSIFSIIAFVFKYFL
jgi:hypothetical protein